MSKKIWHFDFIPGRLAHRAYEEAMRKHRVGDSILDAGCGHGQHKPLFHGKKYTGFDICKNSAVDVVGTVEKMPFPDESFDLVFSNAVWEHVADVESASCEVYRVLKHGGMLLLITHGVWPIHGEPHDYRRWTPYGLKYEFRNFEAVEVVQLGSPTANAVMLVNCYLRRWQLTCRFFRFMLAPLVALLNVFALFSKPTSNRPATLAACYIVTAIKK